MNINYDINIMLMLLSSNAKINKELEEIQKASELELEKLHQSYWNKIQEVSGQSVELGNHINNIYKSYNPDFVKTVYPKSSTRINAICEIHNQLNNKFLELPKFSFR